MAPICEHCIKGYRLPGTPKGTMTTIGGISTYHTSAPGSSSASGENKAIVLFHDIFGLPLGNPQILADEFAHRVGCDVYVPDLFNGSPPIRSEALEPYETPEAGAPEPFFKKLRYIWKFLFVLPKILFGTNSTGEVAVRMTKFTEILKAEKRLTRLGAAGYCYGGVIVVRLAPTKLLETAVILHPGNVSNKEFSKIQHPTSFVCAEEDPSFGPAKAHETETLFASRKGADKVVYEFHEYKGTKHGFAARPALEYPVIKKAFDDAFEQSVAWFYKTL